MGRRYKKLLAMALSAALILQGQAMTVSATSSDLLNQDEDVAEETFVSADEGEEPVYDAADEEDVEDEESLYVAADGENTDGESGEEETEAESEPVDETKTMTSLFDDSALQINLEVDSDEDFDKDSAFREPGTISAQASNSEFEINNGVLVKYTGSDDYVYIPDGVTEIGVNAFLGKEIKGVFLPNSVRIIGNSAFWKCRQLRTINLENVTSIGDSAFYLCDKLESANMVNAEEIDKLAFRGCTSLSSIVLSDKLEVIRESTFLDCENLCKFNLPNSLKQIEETAFALFSQTVEIEELVLPENIETIGVAAFNGCRIIKMVIPNNYSGDYLALSGATIRQLFFEVGRKEISTNLIFQAVIKHIYIPEEVTRIGNIRDGVVIHGKPGSYAHQYAKENGIPFFYNELKLNIEPMEVIEGDSGESQYTWQSDNEQIAVVDNRGVVSPINSGTCNIYAKDEDGVEIGKCTVTVPDFLIDDNVLVKYTGSDEDITIPDGVTEIGFRVFADNTTIKSIKMSDSVKVIGNYAFANCSGLKSIDLGNVEEIGFGAFWCQDEAGTIDEIVMPKSLKRIESYAFAGWNISKLVVPQVAVDSRNILLDSNIHQLYFEDGSKEISDRLLAAVTVDHIYIPKEVSEIGYIPKNTTIHGMPESAAHQYAKEHGNTFFYDELSVDLFSHADVMENGLTNIQYTWESDDETIATVDEKGHVYGASNGTCYITARDENGLEIGRCLVTVEGFGILQHPVSVKASAGDTVEFNVSGSSVNSYQWYFSKDGGKTWSKSSMKGADTDTLVVSVTSARIGQMYKCRLTGINGDTLDSEAATIMPIFEITRQPENAITSIGETIALRVDASGVKEYQWYYSQNGGKTWIKSSMKGNKSNVMTVPVTTTRIGQKYRCQVTGKDGRVLVSNTVTIKKAAPLD